MCNTHFIAVHTRISKIQKMIFYTLTFHLDSVDGILPITYCVTATLWNNVLTLKFQTLKSTEMMANPTF